MAPANSYGTVDHSAPQNGESSNEEAPLLSKAPKSSPYRLRKHMTADVRRERADLILLLCYIITGLLDSSAVFIWGSFVSMQTGNTVYLGLGLVEPAASTRWIKSLISIGFFCFGSLCFSLFHRYFSPRRRWVLCASFGVQMLMIVVAAVMVTVDPNDGDDLRVHVVLPLALVAFQSSGQAVTSRALQYNSLTSVVLTSIYCDLFSDPALLSLHNVERNRRAAAPVLLLMGAILGGVWAHSEVGLEGALWTAVALKALIIVAWVAWKSESESDDGNEG